MTDGEVAPADRQVLHLRGVDDRRALAALRLNERGLAGDVDDFRASADFEDRARERATRSAPLTGMPLRVIVLKPSIVTSSV